MNRYPSIDISGNIISPDLLQKLEQDNFSGQQVKDFGFDRNTRMRDEISQAWATGEVLYRNFKRKLERVKEHESGTTETRNQWLYPLLGALGYNPAYEKQSQLINDKNYHINSSDETLDGFPIITVGWNESLDKKPENTRLSMSPHAVLQEYLNLTEHTYGLVSNGKLLRLLRDSGRMSRLSYVEWNLERIFEEGLYNDFAILFRLLHSSRMPRTREAASESQVEKYHQLCLDEGSAIREKLSYAVEQSILSFANALLSEPRNTTLHEALERGSLTAPKFYQHLLRLIYRLLFLMVTEERNLVFPQKQDATAQRLADIYFRFYSISRLRRMVDKRYLVHPHKSDLYISLLQCFRLFEQNKFATQFGLQALNGELFGTDALGVLNDCSLSNEKFLDALQHLCYFRRSDKEAMQRVNYGALNVEEFGSVYEGLLEYEPHLSDDLAHGNFTGVRFSFITGKERSKSGSHYTPEELVQPLIKHSLDYLLADRRKIIDDAIKQKKLHGNAHREAREALVQQHIYSLKVCDVACGSGHILISAARRIAETAAALIEEEEQPNPTGYRAARREVIRHCIYGVDKNPLAVELCKVALWLEAHNPGHPLSFLDHHIKCGDAIVGLAHKEELENGIATEAFKAFTEEEKDTHTVVYGYNSHKQTTYAAEYAKQNNKERKEREANSTQLKADFEKATDSSVNEAMVEYKTFYQLPETTPEEIEKKANAYRKFLAGKGHTFLQTMANTQVAQFFIPKTTECEQYLMTDADFRQILSGYKGWQDKRTAYANSVAEEKKFFHWFIEFPEVYEQDGFDCILGNPPYLGGRKISTNYGDIYFSYVKETYPPNFALTDYVVFFLKRDLQITRTKGFVSIITTDTIAQGDSRKACFDELDQQGSEVVFANTSMVWPGKANTTVTLFSIYQGKKFAKYILNNRSVTQINSYLTDQENLTKPFSLFCNLGKSGLGYYILGDGFIINEGEKNRLLQANPKNAEVIFPYLNGDDINNDVLQGSDRNVIYFYDWTVEKAKQYEEVFQIVLEKVYPERQQKKDKGYREKWWQYARRAKEISQNISRLNRFFVAPQTTKYISVVEGKIGTLFSHMTIGFSYDNFSFLSLVQSTFYDLWVRTFSSTIGATIRLTPTDSFETFPFPQSLNKEPEEKLERVGKQYHEHRKQLMFVMQLGLTKTYNAFHAKEIKPGITTATLQSLDKKAIEKQYGKEVWTLWNHLQKTQGVCTIEEAIAGIVKLRELHVQMDNAVLDAYGWNDIQLRHDFYEVDYLPQNDRMRYTIHPDARKEILKRLLELNHKIHAQEVAKGLWDKKKGKKKYEAEEGEVTGVVEPESVYKQPKLFEEPNLFNKKGE